MLNLLSSELHENNRLYNRAYRQWQKVVGGIGLMVCTGYCEYISVEAKMIPLAVALGGVMLGGAGLTGFGLGQLQETSRDLAESLRNSVSVTGAL